MGGTRGTPQQPGAGERDALQTNLPQHARADLALRQRAQPGRTLPRRGGSMGKLFLQEFGHTRNSSSFLAMKSKQSCCPSCSLLEKLRTLPALRVHLCRAWGCGERSAGGNRRVARTMQSCCVLCELLRGRDLSACRLWLGIPGLGRGCGWGAAGIAPAQLAVASPGSRAGGVSAPSDPDNLFWLCPGSTVPGSAVTTAGTPSRTRRSCSACWPGRSRGRRSSSWGAGRAPGSAPRLPPTRSPTTQVAPAEADG